MSARMLQVNFLLNCSIPEYHYFCASIAEKLAAVPGLRWKMWLLDQARGEAGGLYVFEDAAAMVNFLQSDLAEEIQVHPALDNFRIRDFEVMADVSAVTRAPLEVTV